MSGYQDDAPIPPRDHHPNTAVTHTDGVDGMSPSPFHRLWHVVDLEEAWAGEVLSAWWYIACQMPSTRKFCVINFNQLQQQFWLAINKLMIRRWKVVTLVKKNLPNCSTILKPFLNFQLLKSVRSTWIYEPQTLHACILYVHVNGQRDGQDGRATHTFPPPQYVSSADWHISATFPVLSPFKLQRLHHLIFKTAYSYNWHHVQSISHDKKEGVRMNPHVKIMLPTIIHCCASFITQPSSCTTSQSFVYSNNLLYRRWKFSLGEILGF